MAPIQQFDADEMIDSIRQEAIEINRKATDRFLAKTKDLQITNGILADTGLELSLYENVRMCRGVDCWMFDRCTLEEKNEYNQCKWELEHMSEMGRVPLMVLQKAPDPIVAYFVGFILWPLHYQAVVMAYEIAKARDFAIANKLGRRLTDGALSEQRKVLSAITLAWDRIGLSELARNAKMTVAFGSAKNGAIKRVGRPANVEDDDMTDAERKIASMMKKGDPSYYAALETDRIYAKPDEKENPKRMKKGPPVA